jgi:hypothetical protein
MRSLLLNSVLVVILLISGVTSAEAQGTRVDFSTIPKSGTILIYSHMDDDLIWMLPFWKISEKFIGGAMPATPSFRTIVSQQQSFMNSNGYNIEYQANWYTPWDDITDKEYTDYYWGANASYNYLLNDHLETRLFNNTTELSRYEINKIKAKLEQYFADPSMRRVISHNNWGEYGHQHHIAINKAVRELAVKYRRDVWMLGCNSGDFVDVNVPNGITYAYGSFNTPSLYTGIRTIYSNNGRWSWYTDRVPSGDHKFIRIVEAGNDKSNILKGDPISYPGPAQQASGAYIFDGDDDYLTLKGNNNTSFTISMRVMPDQIRDMDIAAMSEYPASGKNDRNLYLNSEGRVIARIYDGSSKIATSSARISAATWTQIAITGNGSNLKLYINGTLDRTITAGSAITNYSTPEFILGQATQTGTYFKGQINDVRMYNRVLTDSEIAQLSGKGYTVTSSAGAGGTITPSGSIAIIAGSSISFSIRPNSGYRIADVRTDNTSRGAITSYEFRDISGDHAITASFQRIAFTISAGAGTGGKIEPDGKISADYGSKRLFAVKPDKGYIISDVLVDNVSVGHVSEYVFENITVDHSISATFVPLRFNIESIAGQGGSINPSGITGLQYGNNQNYSITQAKNYLIEDVIVDNVSVGAVTNYSFRNVTSDHSISVRFRPTTFTVTAISGEGGSISPVGDSRVQYGQGQSYTIVPEYGYRINNLIVDFNPVSITSNEFNFRNITENHTILVNFAKLNKYSINIGYLRNGSISPSGDTTVFEGTDQTYKIIPAPGYRVSMLFIDTMLVGPVNEYTFSNISSDHTISATFSSSVQPEIYPNPFKQGFSLNIRSPYDLLYEIKIITLGNKVVYQNSEIQSNTPVYLTPVISRGFYIINVYLKGKKVATVRMVKN